MRLSALEERTAFSSPLDSGGVGGCLGVPKGGGEDERGAGGKRGQRFRPAFPWRRGSGPGTAAFADGLDLRRRYVEELQKFLVFLGRGAFELGVPAMHLLLGESA